jgi:hypothetical protein
VEGRIKKIENLIKKAEESGKEEKARVSLTDGEASLMHKYNTSIPAYNAQLAVTEDQLVIYADVTGEPVDINQTKKAVETIETTVQEKPPILVADTGYGGGENLRYLEENQIDGYIPESNEVHIGEKRRPRPHLFGKEAFRYEIKGKYSQREVIVYRTERGTCNSCAQREKCTINITVGRAITRDGYEDYRMRMRKKITTEEGRSIYGKRKCIVEPVFGQMKLRSGFSQFLLKGLEKARLEWKITATAHNLLKITAAIMKKKQMLPALG